MNSECLRIPYERIAVLIGPKGKTKKDIEGKTNCNIQIDSNSGEVEINYEGSNESELFKAANIVKAIGRGFSPEHAFALQDDESAFETVNLVELVGKSSAALLSKKGRVIGKKGRARKKIEEETETYISVYGKTVSIIGKPENIKRALRAIEMLLQGSEHKIVFNYLGRREKEKFEL